ncbi:MAG: hypothetical protein EOP33_09400 [Rickettsiaceae bacterium]|nr:MAG: hypothetical protein EOP33_09400 [Rickettsiaceae bacterium]
MNVPDHSAGMQSMFWGARDFGRKRTKTQVQQYLFSGPGFAVRTVAISERIAWFLQRCSS